MVLQTIIIIVVPSMRWRRVTLMQTVKPKIMEAEKGLNKIWRRKENPVVDGAVLLLHKGECRHAGRHLDH
jgi:hypothetical protein